MDEEIRSERLGAQAETAGSCAWSWCGSRRGTGDLAAGEPRACWVRPVFLHCLRFPDCLLCLPCCRQAVATGYVPVRANVVSRTRTGRAYHRGVDAHGRRDTAYADVEVRARLPVALHSPLFTLLRFRTSMDVVVHETEVLS